MTAGVAVSLAVLALAGEHQPSPLCGFLHVPHTPEEVAQCLANEARASRAAAQRSELASMELERIVRAAAIAITETTKVLDRCEATA